MNYNRILLGGRLTADPDQKEKCTLATIAVDRPKYGDKEKETDFLNLVAFGKTAEFLSKYFQKGSQIFVEGRLQNDKWEDKDGNKRITAKIIVEKIDFVGSKTNDTNSQKPNVSSNSDFQEIGDDDELPF